MAREQSGEALVVYLPQGSVGIELEAARREGVPAQLLGCRVRAWRSPGALAKRVTRGSLVVGETCSSSFLLLILSAVDDQPVETEAFHAIVSRLKRSVRRKVVFRLAAETDRRGSDENHPPSPCCDKAEPAHPLKSLLSPAQLLRLMQTEHKERAASIRPVLGDLVSSPKRASAPHVAEAQLEELTKAFSAKEEEVVLLQRKVRGLKQDARGSAGQLLLAHYRLSRSRERGDAADVTPEVSASLFRHWRRLQSVLDQLLGRHTESASSAVAGEMTLAQQLEVQTALSRRLEVQLREWVEGRIESHRAEAVAEVLRGNIAEEPKESTPTESSLGRKATRPPGYDERGLWLSARRSVFAGKSPESCLSPSSFKEHMRRLRDENNSIKDDIVRFRNTLRVSGASIPL